MAIESNSLPGEAQINTEIFHKYFPDAKINAVDMTLLPPRVVEYFEGANRLGIDPKDYKEGDFINLFIIQHNSGDTTYVARQIKVSPKTLIENNPYYPLKEDLTYLLEIDPEGKDIGEAHIRMGVAGDDRNPNPKPIVGWTGTGDENKRRGLGLRRYFMMNALSQMLYGMPLHSSVAPQPEAKRLWEKLAAEGKARQITYKDEIGEYTRYVFV